MPRQARIDAPCALHHIIARGIERSKIFRNDADYEDFLRRLGFLLLQTETKCFAWALISNHFHLLLKTGNVPISLDHLQQVVAPLTGIEPEDLVGASKARKVTKGRILFCYIAVREMGITMAIVRIFLLPATFNVLVL